VTAAVPAPVGRLRQAATDDDRLPIDWLRATGRAEDILTAWAHGALAEVPTGIAFDVVRIPLALAHETVRRLREAGIRPGPVIAGPSGAEVLVPPGDADGLAVDDADVLRTGRWC